MASKYQKILYLDEPPSYEYLSTYEEAKAIINYLETEIFPTSSGKINLIIKMHFWTGCVAI